MARTDRKHNQRVKPDKGLQPVAPHLPSTDWPQAGPPIDPEEHGPSAAQLRLHRPTAQDLRELIEEE